MRNKIVAVSAIALMLGMASLPDQVAFASEAKDATSDVSVNNENQDASGKQAGKEKWKAAAEKWNALSADKKNEVYKILEKRQALDATLIDKFVSLGIMDSEDAAKIKEESKEMLAEAKESGKLPMGRKHPPKEGSKQDKTQQKQK